MDSIGANSKIASAAGELSLNWETYSWKTSNSEISAAATTVRYEQDKQSPVNDGGKV